MRSRELRKRGRKIRLQDQPFQVLAILLERPGEVVTREELRQKLWPADTFVDFDHGLNNAINRLREALCDSAENPLFIETLPRRGYRFIAPIAVEKLAEPTGLLEERSSPPAPAVEESIRIAATEAGVNQNAPSSDDSGPPQPYERNPDHGPSYKLRLPQGLRLNPVALASVLLVMTGVGWLTWHWSQAHNGPASAGRIQSLAVLPLENLSGDTKQEYFADGMTAELITELAKISSLRVISRTSAMR